MNATMRSAKPGADACLQGPATTELAELAELVARVRARDEAASRLLVERLYPVVAKVVQANLPRRDDLEDLMQEVFLKVFSRLDQYRGDAPFEHWVSRMALTTCLDRLRRQKVRPELRWSDLTEEEQRVLDNTAPPAEATDADAATAGELLEKLLEHLPEADAWLIRQVEVQGKSLAEVCAEAGWNGGAARVRLFRARHRLRAAFRQLERTQS
jgi:RNA polymerase sigma-70 factor (ECF subfamily)